MIQEKIVKNFNKKLTEKDLTIFCGESITAGLLASTIASIPGASSVLKGGIVTYDADVKTKILGVDPEIISTHTAESQETTNAMCYGLKHIYPDASIHVAVTGVASKPTNDYAVDKEVGQIYVSILYMDKLKEFNTVITPTSFDTRNEIRHKTVEFIFDKIEALI